MALFSWGMMERDSKIEYKNKFAQCLQEKDNYEIAQISSSKLIKELREKSTKVVSKECNIDCYNIPLPDYVKQLFEQLK